MTSFVVEAPEVADTESALVALAGQIADAGLEMSLENNRGWGTDVHAACSGTCTGCYCFCMPCLEA